MPFISAVNGSIQEGTLEREINVRNETGLSVVQGETLSVSKASLVANDVGAGAPTIISVQNPVGGTVVLNELVVEFTSTGTAGDLASFEYTVSDNVATANGIAYINTLGLPDVLGLMFNLEVDAAAARASDDYVPPTIEEIFNSWGRFDGAQFFEGTDPNKSSNAAAWQLLQNPDRVLMPLNVSPANGFISPDTFENYSLEATLTSESDDNDTNGLIVAFEREGETNHVLALAVSKAGSTPTSGYGLIYFQNDSGFSDTQSTILAQPNFGLNLEGGWNGSQIRLKIVRNRNIIKCYATQFDQTDTYIQSSEIVFDLSTNSNTQRFMGPSPYGYMTFSQPDSAYVDIVFGGGADNTVIYDAENNQVWNWNEVSETWDLDSTTAHGVLGFPRLVTNPNTTERFKLQDAGIIQYLGRSTAADFSTVAVFNETKVSNETQNIFVRSSTGGTGVGAGVDVIGLYALGLEETNLLAGKPTLTTTSEYANNSNAVGSGSYFSDNEIIISNLIGGNVVFADGTVGTITSITQSTIAYTVTTDFELYDETLDQPSYSPIVVTGTIQNPQNVNGTITVDGNIWDVVGTLSEVINNFNTLAGVPGVTFSNNNNALEITSTNSTLVLSESGSELSGTYGITPGTYT